jgi:hypothetical protein
MFENPDSTIPEDLKPPRYPERYDDMDPEAGSQADELIRRQPLFYLYRVFNGGLNKTHLSALADPPVLTRQHLVKHAGRQWMGNLMALRGALINMCNAWPSVPGKPAGDKACPIEFSPEEVTKQAEDEPMWYNLNELVAHWRDELAGLSEEG